MHHFGEACKGPRRFDKREKHSMTFWLPVVILVRLSTGHRRWGTKLKNKIFGRYTSGVIHPRHWTKVIIHSYWTWKISITPSQLTYVIKKPFSFTPIINDMKRALKKVFKSKKPSLGTKDGLGPATGPTDLMQSSPAFYSELDGTKSRQVAPGVSVSIQLHTSHL